MNSEKHWLPNSHRSSTPPRRIVRRFGGLKVRYKLVVLHNLFFIVLAAAVYGSVIPVFSHHIEGAMQRELHMVSHIFNGNAQRDGEDASSELAIYHFRRGTAFQLHIPQEGTAFLHLHPAATWQMGRDSLFRMDAKLGYYQEVSLDPGVYERDLRQAKRSLFLVLGTIYVLTIIVMELIIMPQFVYQPLHLMLEADEAIQRDDRENELIDERYILNDEIGQIMHSRNATIAQLRAQEDDLANALQKLEEQDRLVSLGLLSTSVAHELNTPLAVLQGSIEKLLETVHEVQTSERLHRMLRVTQRLRKISEGLVDFARVRKQETESVSLRPIIDESWSLVAIDEKAAMVDFRNLVAETQCVVGNADRLVQVFVNLLRNALLAVDAGGEVEVRARLMQRAGQCYVCCAVLDNGPGIPTHILPNLFEAFVSTRLDARGTGLGLTVAEGIISQHGGMISASNRPEGGAVLEVLLPAAA